MGCNVEDCDRISSLLDAITDQMKTGFSGVTDQLREIRTTQKSYEERLRKVELTLASSSGERYKTTMYREWIIVLFAGASLVIGLGSLAISWIRGV